jgi:hypothetical protein
MHTLIQKRSGSNNIQTILASVVILAVVLVGVHLLVGSHAQTLYVSNVASSGSIAGQSQVQMDNTTSRGNSVQFGLPYYTGKLLSVQSTNEDVTNLHTLNANSFRSEINFDTTTNTFDDEQVLHDDVSTATLINKLTTAHIQDVPLMESYVNINPNPNITTYIDPTIWANAVVSWCQKWCIGGSYYKNNPAANGYYAPRILEMLNEPYGGWYRNGAVPPQGYANMLIATRNALDKAGLSDVGILGAVGNAADTTTTAAWTNNVAAAGGYKNLVTGKNVVTGLAVHPYADVDVDLPVSNPAPKQNGWDTVYYWHQQFNMDMYVTEVGWCAPNTVDNGVCKYCPSTTSTTNCVRANSNRTETQKEQDITNAIDQLGSVSWIKDFNYYNMHDYSSCFNLTSGGCAAQKTTPCSTLSNAPCVNLILGQGLFYYNVKTPSPAFTAFQIAAMHNGFPLPSQ